MPPPSAYVTGEYTEGALIEQSAIALFADLGWETANLFNEWTAARSSEGRETQHDVIFIRRLQSVLERLNSELPTKAILQAVEELPRDCSKMIPEQASREIYRLLKDGFRQPSKTRMADR